MIREHTNIHYAAWISVIHVPTLYTACPEMVLLLHYIILLFVLPKS